MMQISKHQLFCLIILFEIGSTTIFALGIQAKQDAWIAILFSMLCGFVLLWIYTELQKNFPDKNLADIIVILLGKILGGPLVLLYALFFLYISTRNLRDFGEFISITFLQSTPLVVIHIIAVITLLYIFCLGLEVFGRTSEITLPVVLVSIISIFVLIWISGRVDLSELTPVLAKGVKPVFKAAYPAVVNFPFGQVAVFLMYWCYTHSESKQTIRKTSFLAVGISGLLLTVTLVIIVSVLGADYASSATTPLLEVIKLINIGEILTNLDSIGIIIMFLGGLYKIGVFFYGGALALATLFKIKDTRWVIIPSGLFVLWLSVIFEPNYPYHLWLGNKFSIPYMYTAFQIVIPPLLLMICWLKKKSNKICQSTMNKGW